MKSELILLSGASHFDIKSTCNYESSKFINGESRFRLLCSVRYKPVIIVQSFPETNDNLMELLLAIDAVKRAGAFYINVILTVFPYARQDRKHKSGVPISSKLACDLIRIAGANRVVTFDLHADQIQGFMGSDVIFDHVELTSFMSYNLKRKIKDIHSWTFVAPDAGAVKRAKKLADACGASELAIMDKTRTKANIVDKIQLIGEVKGRNCIIVDDIIDTGGTLYKAVEELATKLAIKIVLLCTHGVFSAPAYEILDGTDVICTNTLPIFKQDGAGNPCIQDLTIFNIEPFLHDLINRIDHGNPLGPLFSNWRQKKN